VGAIDIQKFRNVAFFRKSISELATRWNAQPLANEKERILYPGQPEQISRAHRLSEGIPIGVNLLSMFETIAQKAGIDWKNS
jgi:LDH2 family malate/lactate/ureidoglycolate dehydrogenase